MKREVYLWILLLAVIAVGALYYRYSYQPTLSIEVSMNSSGAGSVSYPYQNARLPISVYNNGGSPIRNMSVGLFVNGNLTTLYKITLPAGKQTTIPFNYTPSKPGTYNITAVADPDNLYAISDRAATKSGAVLRVKIPENATPYALLPSNGLLSRKDIALSNLGYAESMSLYDRYNASEFAVIDDPQVNGYIEPVLNLTAYYINRIYASDAVYENGDRAYSLWISGYLGPSIFGVAATGRGLVPRNITTSFGNMTFVKISNDTTACGWYSGGWLKMLAYSGNATCYQALNESGEGAPKSTLLGGPLQGKLNVTGGSLLADYAGASGGTSYVAGMSLLSNATVMYDSISNNTVESTVCYGEEETVNGTNYCSAIVILASGGLNKTLNSPMRLVETTAYVGARNLTAISLFNTSPSSYQLQNQWMTNIAVIRDMNVSGTSAAFSSGLTNTCAFNDSFPCKDVSFVNGTIGFALKNALNQSVRIENLGCNATLLLTPSNTSLSQEIPAGGTYNATVPCYNYLGKIKGVALNLRLNLQMNYSVANVTHSLSGKAYVLLGSP
jgi:hypothetical protein